LLGCWLCFANAVSLVVAARRLAAFARHARRCGGPSQAADADVVANLRSDHRRLRREKFLLASPLSGIDQPPTLFCPTHLIVLLTQTRHSTADRRFRLIRTTMWPNPRIRVKTQVADKPPSKFLEKNQKAKNESDALKHQRWQHDIQVAMLSAYRSNVGGRMGGWHLSGRSHPSDTEGGSEGCGLRCFFIRPGRIDPSSHSI
jgi:hypothetical protein